jgi:hypothetical protein
MYVRTQSEAGEIRRSSPILPRLQSSSLYSRDDGGAVAQRPFCWRILPLQLLIHEHIRANYHAAENDKELRFIKLEGAHRIENILLHIWRDMLLTMLVMNNPGILKVISDRLWVLSSFMGGE